MMPVIKVMVRSLPVSLTSVIYKLFSPDALLIFDKGQMLPTCYSSDLFQKYMYYLTKLKRSNKVKYVFFLDKHLK